MRTRTASELSPDEKALWIQSGLAVSPLMGTYLQHSLDFCLAWALIGEWTSRVLFPVPKDMGMRVPSFRIINAVHLGLWRGHEQPSNKVPSIPADDVKTTHERCGPFSLVVLSQRRGRVTTSSGPTLSETLSSKTLQVS